MKDHYAFPAYFYFAEDGISIEFPDLPGCLSCAHSQEEAFHNAKETLGLHLYGMEKDGEDIPEPTPVPQLHPEENAAIVMVEVFMPAIRDRIRNQPVRHTVTLPAWLSTAAREQDIDLSHVLQQALENLIGSHPAH